MIGSRNDEDLIRDYLRRLHRASARLPRRERRELEADIREHLAAAQRRGEGEAYIRQVLDDLGEPAEIVAAAGVGAPAATLSTRDLWTLVLLLVGAFVFVLPWFVGVLLLWTSESWSVDRKVLGTLVLPGGLATSLLLLDLPMGGDGSGVSGVCPTNPSGVVSHCTNAVLSSTGSATLPSWLAILLLVLTVAAPIFTTVVLYRQARGRRSLSLALG